MGERNNNQAQLRAAAKSSVRAQLTAPGKRLPSLID